MRWKTALLVLVTATGLAGAAVATPCSGAGGVPGSAEAPSPAGPGQGCVGAWITDLVGGYKIPSFPLPQLASDSPQVQGYIQQAQAYLARGGQPQGPAAAPDAAANYAVPDDGSRMTVGGDAGLQGAPMASGVSFEGGSALPQDASDANGTQSDAGGIH